MSGKLVILTKVGVEARLFQVPAKGVGHADVRGGSGGPSPAGGVSNAPSNA